MSQSVVTLQVKPWDDTTDLVELEKNVRAVEMDGLVWGLSTLKEVAFGLRMLQINLVIGMIFVAKNSGSNARPYRGR